jgi:hypothetical protein
MTEIIELNKKILEEKSDSYLATLENLKWYEYINKDKLLKYFNKLEENSKIFIALNNNKEIIWSITILIEYKLIRWWVKAWRIEDIWVKTWYEWKWIWKLLVEKAIDYWKNENVYKITLSASEQVEWFYKKIWFKRSSTNFKMYI